MNTKLIFYTIFIATNAPRSVQSIRWNLPMKKNFGSSSRIVGGMRALIKDFPHQVSIQVNGYHICGGSIISKNWVLTAAHCVQHVQMTSLKIRSGSTFTTRGGKIHRISKIISHELYNETKIVNDIALILVKARFEWRSRRGVIKLIDAKRKIRSGTMAYIIGWGVRREGGSVSFNLQKVKIPIVSSLECQHYLGHMEHGQICAGYKSGGYDACQGDSGGPLLVGNLLVGLVSWGEGCARPDRPGVYTEVAYYRAWIQNKCKC